MNINKILEATNNWFVNNLELTDSISNLNLSNPNNESHALLLTSKYTGNSSSDVAVYLSLDNLQGDLNEDGQIDVQDIIILVILILDDIYNSTADLNQDGYVNVSDVVALINIILNN